MNSAGLTFAIAQEPNAEKPNAETRVQSGAMRPKTRHRRTQHPPLSAWQEWRDSNPQPPVLETGALAN